MSGCGVSGYGMSGHDELIPSLSPWRRHEGHVFGLRIPRDQMGCRLPERGQALEAQVVEMEPAISDRLASDLLDLGYQPSRAP